MQYALILMTRNCMANALISSYAKIMSISNLLSTNSVHLYVKEYKFGFSIFWYDSQISLTISFFFFFFTKTRSQFQCYWNLHCKMYKLYI